MSLVFDKAEPARSLLKPVEPHDDLFHLTTSIGSEKCPIRDKLLGEEFMYLFLRCVERQVADVKCCRCVQNREVLEFFVGLARVSKSSHGSRATFDLDRDSTYALGLSSRSSTGPPRSVAMKIARPLGAE